VKHGKVNATLPDEKMINTVTLEEAVDLLAAKAGKGKARAGGKARGRKAA
jgi:DNA topoisomerase-1